MSEPTPTVLNADPAVRLLSAIREGTHGRVTGLKVGWVGGRAVIAGEVGSYYLKQLVVESCRRAGRADVCVANVRVRSRPDA